MKLSVGQMYISVLVVKNLPYSGRRVHYMVDGGGAVTQPLREFQQWYSVVSPLIAKKRLV